MTQDARFGELRSILQRPAAKETWGALCQNLNLWDLESLEHVALPYVLDLVTRWPTKVTRSAPKPWIQRALGGEDVAQLAAANVLVWASRNLSHVELLALTTSPRLANLTCLDLSWNQLGDAGAAALATSQHLTRLTLLDLSWSQIGDDGATALAESPHLTRLTVLKLPENQLGDEGAAALAASPHLATLNHLDLSKNNIGDAGASALAASPYLSKFTDLLLYDNDIGPDGAAALAASPHLRDSIRAQWRKP
jgi:hypothetical protein